MHDRLLFIYIYNGILMLRIYYTIFESISHEEEKVDECNGFKRFNRFTGLAPGAYRPLIACEREGEPVL